MATFFAAFFFATFFTAFLAGAFFATFFLAAAFFAGAFFAAFFLATIFNSRRDGDFNLTTCYLKFKLRSNSCRARVVKSANIFSKKFISDESIKKQIYLGKFHLKNIFIKFFSNDFRDAKALKYIPCHQVERDCALRKNAQDCAKNGALMFGECARLNEVNDA